MYDGSAWVSLVAFNFLRYRWKNAPTLSHWLMRLMVNHALLNVRAYVNVDGVRGIHFIHEWLDKKTAIHAGRLTHDLPYNYADIEYRHHMNNGHLRGRVMSPRHGNFSYFGMTDEAASHEAKPGMLEHFLVERYEAFTHSKGRRGTFHVNHPPWRLRRVGVRLLETELLRSTEPWFARATVAGAWLADDLIDVEMSGWEPLK